MVILHNKKKIINKGIYNKPMEIRLSLLNPDKILKKSSGEVYNANTINPNTLEPEEGGLFCNKIFKTNYRNNYICTVCSYRQNISTRCHRCGSNTRLDRSNTQNLSIGHIILSSPVAHPWFFKSRIIHILCEGLDGIYDYKELNRLISLHPERIYQLFLQMDLLNVYFTLRNKLMTHTILDGYNEYNSITNGSHKTIDYITHKKMRIVASFIRLKQRPEWLFLKVLPVLSPTYRPLMRIDEKLFIASDINFIYQRVIERNNAYKKLLQRYSIQSVKQLSSQYLDVLGDFRKDNPITRAKLNLQKAVVTLIDSSFDKTGIKNKSKSIVRRLMGKEGRFRKDILGKRINFSGRTVITSGPRLHLNQCALPLEIGFELFKPFILLKIRDLYLSYRQDEVSYEQVKAVYRMINDLISKHPILLNRAPTLHRLNIQSFSPLLIQTKAIQLHPLVCSSFNADFDGDTMAIYVPHTVKSQVEARLLMLSSQNIVSPATYDPIISPSQDIVFGIYYLSIIYEGSFGEGRYFNNIRQLRYSIDDNHLNIHAPIHYLLPQQVKYVLTTPGRVFLYHVLSMYTLNISFNDINKVLDKKGLVILIKSLLLECGMKKTSLILDQIMSLGFYYAFKSGITFHKNDINVPNLKTLYVQRTQKRVSLFQKEARRNNISKEDVSKRLLNEWSKCTTVLTHQLVKDIIYTISMRKSSIYMLIQSGARGSMIQMRQLCGLRGLMIKPSGDILEIPILSNFKEGLSLVDYFNSTHGARKGVIDTSLKTAISGYLTRKLFYASKDLFIIEEDCGTKKGLLLGDIRFASYSHVGRTIYKDLIGRYSVQNIKDPQTGRILVIKGSLITERHSGILRKHGVEFAIIRSPITCESRNGICKQCYGSNIDTTKKISFGESIGIIAAQSIGEPGTQLTMRTFHQGGTVLKGGSAHRILAPIKSRVLFFNKKYLKIDSYFGNSSYINLHRNSKLILLDDKNLIQYVYAIPYGSILYVQDGSFVSKHSRLFEWDPYTTPIISNHRGVVYLNNNNRNSFHFRDNLSGLISLAKKRKEITLENKYFLDSQNGLMEFSIMPTDIITVKNGQSVRRGSLLGYIRKNQRITQDITGGLSKISKLFECIQSQCSLISPAEGYVVLRSEHSIQNRLTVYIQSKDPSGCWRYVRAGVLRDGLSLYVRENDYVYKGDVLSDGIIPIRDLAEKISFESSIYSLLDQIQAVYLENGVSIHQKHVEVILSQMYSKVANNELKTYLSDESMIFSSSKGTSFDTIYKNTVGSFKDKSQIYRYPREYYYSKVISLLVMGLAVKKNRLSLTGISDVTYQSSSFLSAASFQKTSKVLTEAALWRGLDPLMGAQANLFFGYLMPMGTGTIRLYKDLYLKNNYENYS